MKGLTHRDRYETGDAAASAVFLSPLSLSLLRTFSRLSRTMTAAFPDVVLIVGRLVLSCLSTARKQLGFCQACLIKKGDFVAA